MEFSVPLLSLREQWVGATAAAPDQVYSGDDIPPYSPWSRNVTVEVETARCVKSLSGPHMNGRVWPQVYAVCAAFSFVLTFVVSPSFAPSLYARPSDLIRLPPRVQLLAAYAIIPGSRDNPTAIAFHRGTASIPFNLQMLVWCPHPILAS